ncbi:MAG: hypothetical protein GZ089_00140 [Aromatoleum sp.]|nr:hypothetical protein [Aromatoleum sp.]
MKHVTGAFCPDNGRIYFVGGDYGGQPWVSSYRQETWSLDVAERMANPRNPNAGWRLEYPYAGFGGNSVQPKHPDYVGWQWDAMLHRFWMIPGVMDITTDNPPNETPARASDANFVHDEVMWFDPFAPPPRRWSRAGVDAGIAYTDSWFSWLDPVKRTISRIGLGPKMQVLDIATSPPSWRVPVNLPDNSRGRKPSIWKDYVAIDLSGRCVYTIDPIDALFIRIDMDSGAFSERAPPPGPLETPRAANHTHIVFNSRHRVVEYLNLNDGRLYVYQPSENRWRVAAVDAPNGRKLQARMAVYDPVNDWSMWAGGVDVPNPDLLFYRHRRP